MNNRPTFTSATSNNEQLNTGFLLLCISSISRFSFPKYAVTSVSRTVSSLSPCSTVIHKLFEQTSEVIIKFLAMWHPVHKCSSCFLNDTTNGIYIDAEVFPFSILPVSTDELDTVKIEEIINKDIIIIRNCTFY